MIFWRMTPKEAPMSATSGPTTDHPASLGGRPISELRAKWGWFVALGVLMLIAGALALANLFLATVVSVYYVGALMLAGGAFQIIHAFGVKSWGRFIWWLASGLLYAAAGVVAFVNPILASLVLTLLLAAALVAAGVMRIMVALEQRSEPNWGWILATGVVTALAGLVIALRWPVNSLFILGIFLGVDLIFQGATWTSVGLALKRRAGA
jgi:uncharacterized membrane protein HdeD (DUF308 family)